MKQPFHIRFSSFMSLNRVSLVSVLGCLVLLLAAVTKFEVDRIESKFYQRLAQKTSIAGAEAVAFKMDGRDLIVYGKVPNKTVMDELRRHVAMIEGIRLVVFDVNIAPERTAYLRILNEAANQIRLEGELSHPREVANILAAISKTVPAVQVIDNLVVNSNVSDSTWHEVLEPALEQAADIQNFTLEFELGRMVVNGLLEDKSAYAVMVNNLEKLAADNEVAFVNLVGG